MAGPFKRFKEYIRSNITHISPTLNTKIRYKRAFHRPINLKNPRTIDEKIQWLKLNTYYKDPFITQCADKYAVREYIEQCGCGEILNELYYAWDSVDEINWDLLPQKFVIKWNFACGYNLICHDKSKLNIEEAKETLRKWKQGHKTYYLRYSEMQYKDIKPKLICEKFIETQDGNLPLDYKIYCFNGSPKYVMVCVGRDKQGHGAKYYFVDKEWKFHPISYSTINTPNDFVVPKPQGYEKLFEYAQKITQPFPFVRADFYLEDGKIIFGELTFTPCGGCDPDITPQAQILLGDMVKL